MTINTERVRKSEVLKKTEHAKLIKWVAAHHTKTDAAEAMGLNRMTLDRVLYKGSGAPETLRIVRSAIHPRKTA